MLTINSSSPSSPQMDAVDPAVARQAAALNAAGPPTIPTDPVDAETPTAQDPMELLAEAVSQLKLAVAALNRAQGGTQSPAANATVSGPAANSAKTNPDPGVVLGQQISAAQDEISAYMAARSAGVFGTNGFAAYGDAAVPFAPASFGSDAGFFAEQTSEPEL